MKNRKGAPGGKPRGKPASGKKGTAGRPAPGRTPKPRPPGGRPAADKRPQAGGRGPAARDRPAREQPARDRPAREQPARDRPARQPPPPGRSFPRRSEARANGAPPADGRAKAGAGRPGGHRAPERSDPFTPHDYTVEGLAALSEYVRFKPHAVKSIRVKPQVRAAVASLLSEHGLTLPLGEAEAATAAGESPSPVVARVSLEALDQGGLEARTAGRAQDVILALDHITDPRNLGAIIRSAAFFGVREVIVPERRQVLFTQAAVGTAQGGFALTDLVVVVNLARTLAALKAKGYWVVGTAMDGEPYTDVAHVYDKVVLVLGSEDTGLSKNVRDLCDRLAAIPGRAGGLDSLNVSVASGIFLSAFGGARV